MILSIETATELCGVALVHEQRCIAQRIVVEKNIHSERLMVLVDEVLTEAGIRVASLDGIAVSNGPGSFTGLRIGLSAAKGLAYARSLPLLAVPTLDAIAYEAFLVGRASNSPSGEQELATAVAGSVISHPEGAGVICAVIDAKRDEAYYAFYERSGDDIRCISPHAIATVSEIAAQLAIHGRVVLAGDGAKKVAAACVHVSESAGRGPETLVQVPMIPVHISESAVVCSPAAVGLLAERRFPLLVVPDFSELEPVYIRDFVTTMPRIATQTAIP